MQTRDLFEILNCKQIDLKHQKRKQDLHKSTSLKMNSNILK